MRRSWVLSTLPSIVVFIVLLFAPLYLGPYNLMLSGRFLSLGILAMGEKAGAIDFVAKIIAPFFSRIFPGVPRDHPATGLMVMNYSANFLGLDNAATPIGLKAMESLQTLNPTKDEATDAQLMFLVLNTAGMTLIPVSVMAQRAVAKALG